MTQVEFEGLLATAASGQRFSRFKPGQLIDWLSDLASGLADDLDINKADVLAAVESFYNAVIRPLDLPYIPNFVEKTVDDFILKAILQVIDNTLPA